MREVVQNGERIAFGSKINVIVARGVDVMVSPKRDECQSQQENEMGCR
jgi:hypothetical protein